MDKLKEFKNYLINNKFAKSEVYIEDVYFKDFVSIDNAKFTTIIWIYEDENKYKIEIRLGQFGISRLFDIDYSSEQSFKQDIINLAEFLKTQISYYIDKYINQYK